LKGEIAGSLGVYLNINYIYYLNLFLFII